MNSRGGQILAICLAFLQFTSTVALGEPSVDLVTRTTKSSDCDESSAPTGGKDSPNLSKFIQLSRLGDHATLKDYLVFWYPKKTGVAVTDADLASCINRPWPDYCPIDTVYSWGSRTKLATLERFMPDHRIWKSGPGFVVNTLFSAVGSYGYGIIPVRFKLNSSAYRVFPQTESGIRNSAEVESWSFGTPEHYDEIVRDLKRWKSGRPWFGYDALDEEQDISGKQNSLFFEGEVDGHRFTEEILKKSLAEMVRMILRGEGRVYYAANVCRNRKKAFETKFPTYLNPNSDTPAAAKQG